MASLTIITLKRKLFFSKIKVTTPGLPTLSQFAKINFFGQFLDRFGWKNDFTRIFNNISLNLLAKKYIYQLKISFSKNLPENPLKSDKAEEFYN